MKIDQVNYTNNEDYEMLSYLFNIYVQQNTSISASQL